MGWGTFLSWQAISFTLPAPQANSQRWAGPHTYQTSDIMVMSGDWSYLSKLTHRDGVRGVSFVSVFLSGNALVKQHSESLMYMKFCFIEIKMVFFSRVFAIVMVFEEFNFKPVVKLHFKVRAELFFLINNIYQIF